MNKTAQAKIANYFYNLGVQTAVESTGMDKTAMSASAAKALSRINPMGARNIAAGAGWTMGGAGVGEALAHLSGNASSSLGNNMMLAGGLAGKLLKDRNTIKAVEQLGLLERMAVRKGLANNKAGQFLAPLLSAANTQSFKLPGVLSEAATNAAVRRRLGL